jgi:hypothetical protein
MGTVAMQINSLTVEIFTEIGNDAVVRLPGRKFPGLLVQGDTFHSLVLAIKTICERAQLAGDEELAGEADLLKDRLETMLGRYEEALHSHGVKLPYSKL